MGYAIASYDDFPVNFRRTAPILSDHKHQIENLHKLFPMIVRYPWLMPFAPRADQAQVACTGRTSSSSCCTPSTSSPSRPRSTRNAQGL